MTRLEPVDPLIGRDVDEYTARDDWADRIDSEFPQSCLVREFTGYKSIEIHVSIPNARTRMSKRIQMRTDVAEIGNDSVIVIDDLI